MATRVRKNIVTEVVEETLPKEGFVEEPLEEIVPIEPKVELKEEEAKELVELYPLAPKPIRWKKIGNGSFILNNRHIKPGQTFMATVEEIPKAFRDVVVPVEGLPEDPLLNVKKSSNYSIVEIEGTNTWNIVDGQGKVLNEKPMIRIEAEKLLNAL
jgi:hypothetical protein